MNSATKNLENDHVNILRLIDVMESITSHKKPGIEDLENIVEIIKNYADGYHHAKEEDQLFPLMVERGFSFEQGPVAVMLEDHRQGRNYVKGMHNNICLYKNGDLNAVPLIFENMKGYIDLLRGHIAKENNILFRMADKIMTEHDHEELLKEYADIESNTENGKSLKKYLDTIERLEKEYIK